MKTPHLKCRGPMTRKTVLLQPEQMVVLEHSMASDDVRRIPYDRVERVMVQRRTAWVMLVASTLLGVVPGLALVAAGLSWDAATATGIGVGVGLVGAILFARFAFCGRTYFWIDRDGARRMFSTTASPGAVKRFVNEATRAIPHIQQRDRQQQAQSADAQPPAP